MRTEKNIDNEYVVYCHTNRINGKKYIGKSCNVNARWSGDGREYLYKGRNKPTTVFANAIKKYGWDSFEHIILRDCLTNEEACYWESYYIDLYKTNVNIYGSKYGYNMTSGGDGSPGRKYSEEAIEKMRKSHLGYQPSEETRQKLSNALRGRKLSEDTKKKIGERNSLILKGRKLSPEHVEKIREAGRKRGLPELSHINSAKACSKPIRCLETEELFKSITEASVCYNLSCSNIASVCRGDRLTAGGLHFEYVFDVEQTDIETSRLPDSTRKSIIEYYANKRVLELRNNLTQASYKPVLCIDNNTIYAAGVIAADILGLCNKNISSVCRGRANSTGGLHFRFVTIDDVNSGNYSYVSA